METYVVRIWEPATDDAAASTTLREDLRGEVVHAGTGQRRLFTSLEELAGALRPPLDPRPLR